MSARPSRSPPIQPTASSTKGSRRKENMMVSIPWMKSVTMAALRPPATPYTTKSTVIAGIATFVGIAPPVHASITLAEPRSIVPILTVYWSSPTPANSPATPLS
jgi:hypothetical protein